MAVNLERMVRRCSETVQRKAELQRDLLTTPQSSTTKSQSTNRSFAGISGSSMCCCRLCDQNAIFATMRDQRTVMWEMGKFKSKIGCFQTPSTYIESKGKVRFTLKKSLDHLAVYG